MDIKRILVYNLKGKVTLIGVGNVMKGDDGFGAILAEHLKNKGYTGVINAGPAPENYVRAVRETKPDTVLVIDAADFGGRPADIRLLERKDIPLYGISTHNASLALFFDFLEAETKAKIYMLAVQPAKTNMNTPLSAVLEKKCNELEAILIELLPKQIAV